MNMDLITRVREFILGITFTQFAIFYTSQEIGHPILEDIKQA